MERDAVLSARAVEAMIAEGHAIVIANGLVLRLDAWLERHPGGKLAILHMVGRDATDEINVYHSAKTLRRMAAFRIGRIGQPWTNFTPPIRGGLFRKLVEAETEDKEEDENENDDSESSAEDASSVDLPSGLSLSSSTTSLSLASSTEHGLSALDHALPCDAACDDQPTPLLQRRLYNLKSISSLEQEAAKNLSREEYTAQLMQREVADGIRDYPSLDPATQRRISHKYQALHERVKAEGFYDCHYREYAKELFRYSLIFAAFLTLLHAEWYLTSAVFLGLFWHQIMFTAHDAGHGGITHNFVVDTMIGMFVADFCCGLSIGWWKSSHNVHHLITNDPEHDPDIQNVPLFATCPSFFKSLNSSYYNGFCFAWDAVADAMVPWQAYTYYPVMAIARFNLYLLSWLYIVNPKSTPIGCAAWTRPAEIAFMACYWFLFGYCLLWRTLPTWTLRVAFVLVSHLVTAPLHVQITLSHWGMPTADLGPGESFAQRQLRTTMDVDCPAWLDPLHGGLQFQAVHHLFPRVPRHNLRRLQTLVRAFCEDAAVEYTCLGFVDGNRRVLSRLDDVANMVATLVACQRHMAATGDSGLH